MWPYPILLGWVVDNVSRATTISSVKNILIIYFVVKNVREATHFCVETASPKPYLPGTRSKTESRPTENLE